MTAGGGVILLGRKLIQLDLHCVGGTDSTLRSQTGASEAEETAGVWTSHTSAAHHRRRLASHFSLVKETRRKQSLVLGTIGINTLALLPRDPTELALASVQPQQAR